MPEALRGFRAARMWPVTTNTAAAYATGLMFALPGAQELTKDTKKTDYTIPADDGIYATGSDFLYEDLVFKMAELSLELEASLQGSTYVEADKEYIFKDTDIAPEFAFGYAAAKLDGTSRMFKHPVTKLMSIKVDHKTKAEGNTDIQSYTVTLRSYRRPCDGMIRDTKDGATAAITWLDTMAAFPVVP